MKKVTFRRILAVYSEAKWGRFGVARYRHGESESLSINLSIAVSPVYACLRIQL